MYANCSLYTKMTVRFSGGLRRYGLVLTILAATAITVNLIYLAIYIRINYNLKRYYMAILPKSFIAMYELLKPSGITSYDKDWNTSRTHKMHNLYSLPTITKPLNHSAAGAIHTILW